MTIRFICPVCKTADTAPDTNAGNKVECKQCGRRLKIPTSKQSKTILEELSLPSDPKSSLTTPPKSVGRHQKSISQTPNPQEVISTTSSGQQAEESSAQASTYYYVPPIPQNRRLPTGLLVFAACLVLTIAITVLLIKRFKPTSAQVAGAGVVKVQKQEKRTGQNSTQTNGSKPDGPPAPTTSDTSIPIPKKSASGLSKDNEPASPLPKFVASPSTEVETPPIQPLSPEMLTLLQELSGKDQKAKIAALQTLRKKGQAAQAAATAICDCLLDSSPQVVSAGFEALERVRPDLHSLVSTIMLDKVPANREAAVNQLGRLGSEALPTKKLLESRMQKSLILVKNPQFDSWKARTVEFYPRPLEPQLDIQPFIDINSLIKTLLNIEPDNSAAIKLLKYVVTLDGLLDQNDWHNPFALSSSNALIRLHKWAGSDKSKRNEMLPLLLLQLNSKDERSVIIALSICGEYGTLAKDLLPKIKMLKLSSSGRIREEAKKAADKIELP